ncbi:MAG: hypothetical protein RIS36_880 [Pseudomonadota bacterium]|jgi:hypothetical protein
MSDQSIGTPGPFEVRCESHADGDPNSTTSTIARNDLPASSDEVPRRRYDCERYETCLGLAASLNWESFTCRGCCGQPNENLVWRARVSARKDSVAARLLKAPPIVPLNSPSVTLDAERETSPGS